jgi:hypothetical protein
MPLAAIYRTVTYRTVIYRTVIYQTSIYQTSIYQDEHTKHMIYSIKDDILLLRTL